MIFGGCWYCLRTHFTVSTTMVASLRPNPTASSGLASCPGIDGATHSKPRAESSLHFVFPRFPCAAIPVGENKNDMRSFARRESRRRPCRHGPMAAGDLDFSDPDWRHDRVSGRMHVFVSQIPTRTKIQAQELYH